MTRKHEPRILGILCTWCSYSGADGAGQARLAYPPNVEVVRVTFDPRRISFRELLRRSRGRALGQQVRDQRGQSFFSRRVDNVASPETQTRGRAPSPDALR